MSYGKVNKTTGERIPYAGNSGASEKTFSGTAAEWAALSTAQKKAYDFADITNDYDEAAIGNMAALHTTDKSSIVGAINEVKDEILEDPADFIGTQEAWNALSLAEKTSHTKANITNDFEEAAIGNLSALTTTNKSSVVGAINEVKSGLINKATIPTNSDTLVETVEGGASTNILVANDGYLSVCVATGPTSADFEASVRHSTLYHYGVYLKTTIAAYSSEPIGGLYVKKGETYSVRNAGTNAIKLYLCT